MLELRPNCECCDADLAPEKLRAVRGDPRGVPQLRRGAPRAPDAGGGVACEVSGVHRAQAARRALSYAGARAQPVIA
jgi:hypothetical protein